MASLSLRKQFVRKTLLPFAIIASFLILVVWGMSFSLRQSQADSVLDYRVSVLGLSFSSYLDRAEFEIKYLAQQVSDEGSLDSLFQLHDVLFFGGLDFFYIQKTDGALLEDPRARLYTYDSLEGLAKDSRLNYWRHISTSDGAELLIYKKALSTDGDQRVQGYLFGFISMNNNLALSSDLMSGAQVDFMAIDDVSGNNLLVDQLPTYDSDSPAMSYTGVLLLPSLEDKLTVEVRMVKPFSDELGQEVLVNISIVVISLSILFWMVVHNAYRWMFLPLANLPSFSNSAQNTIHYKEFSSFQEQLNRFQAQLRARDQHLQLLLDSLQSAILFCDESARVTALNKEAKLAFPDHSIAKTIFDMTPIAFHQPIQRALKGHYGNGFELELLELGKVYEWRTYSFINEFGFRSVMLVGRDISEVRHLRWQLASLLPRHSLERPCPDIHTILKEIGALNTAENESDLSARSWLLLVHHLLKQISATSTSEVRQLSLGAFVMEQQDELERLARKGDCFSLVEFDISMKSATRTAAWGDDHKILVQIALLLCMHNSVFNRRLSVQWDKAGLVMRIYGSGEVSPAVQWMLQELPKLVKGHAIIEDGMITLTSAISHDDMEVMPSVSGAKAALIENDYEAVDYCSKVLSSLAVKVDRFSSFEEFLNSSRALRSVYDFVVVSTGNDTGVDRGVERLRALSPDGLLPLIYISHCYDGSNSESSIIYTHQLLNYRLARMIAKVVQSPQVDLKQWLAQGANWLLVGGSDVNQMIWHSELQAYGVVARREYDLQQLDNSVKHASLSVILILDKDTAIQVSQTLAYQAEGIQWVVLEDFAERPDTMLYFSVNGQPPSDMLIERLERWLKMRKG